MFNIVLAHLCGDYLLQSDVMAFKKKESSWVCAYHVIMYMIPFLFLCDLLWWQLLAIAVQHYFQDRTRFITWLMKAKGSWKFATGGAAPWSIIATDNIVHMLWIYMVVQAGRYF